MASRSITAFFFNSLGVAGCVVSEAPGMKYLHLGKVRMFVDLVLQRSRLDRLAGSHASVMLVRKIDGCVPASSLFRILRFSSGVMD